MVQAQAGDLVRVHYTGRLADGTTFDSSMAREPLEFTLGEGELIPGFEHAVLGMTAGESKTTTILADQAYGPHHAERVIDVERHHLPPDLQPVTNRKEPPIKEKNKRKYPVYLLCICLASLKKFPQNRFFFQFRNRTGDYSGGG